MRYASGSFDDLYCLIYHRIIVPFRKTLVRKTTFALATHLPTELAAVLSHRQYQAVGNKLNLVPPQNFISSI